MTRLQKSVTGARILTMCLALSALTGCDKIAAWYDGLAHKNKSSTTPATPPATTSATAPAALPDNVLARIGNWNLTIDEFNERVNKLKDILPEFDPSNTNAKKLILEELIRQQLLVTDAEQSGLAQKKDIVDTVEDFRKTLLVQELATGLTKDIQATEADAKEYYEKNKKDFSEKTEWRVREIVVPDETQANEILGQLLQGADFSETAKTKSKAATAAKGGDKGFASKFSFAQMQNAVATLDVGKTSGVFKGPEGYYIVKLDERKGGEPKKFEDIKSDLVKGLTLRKQQEVILDYLNKLAGKTQIQVNEDLLK